MFNRINSLPFLLVFHLLLACSDENPSKVQSEPEPDQEPVLEEVTDPVEYERIVTPGSIDAFLPAPPPASFNEDDFNPSYRFSTQVNTPIVLEIPLPVEGVVLISKATINGTVENAQDDRSKIIYTPDDFFFGKDLFKFEIYTSEQQFVASYDIEITVENRMVVAQDGFERQALNAEDSIWSGLVLADDKWHLSDEESCSEFACAEIVKQGMYPDDEDKGLGVMAAQTEKGLLIYAKEDSSPENNIHLFSKEIDLSGFDHLSVGFHYLLLGLGDDDQTKDKNIAEYLKVEVCFEGRQSCGLNETFSGDDLLSAKNNWQELYMLSQDDRQLNGRNHQAQDWMMIEPTKVDLTSLTTEQKAQAILKFHVKLSDGFEENDKMKDLVDGVLIDQISIEAHLAEQPPAED